MINKVISVRTGTLFEVKSINIYDKEVEVGLPNDNENNTLSYKDFEKEFGVMPPSMEDAVNDIVNYIITYINGNNTGPMDGDMTKDLVASIQKQLDIQMGNRND